MEPRGLTRLLADICGSQIRAAMSLDLAALHLAAAAVALQPRLDGCDPDEEATADREFLLDRLTIHRTRGAEMHYAASCALDDLLGLLEVGPDLELDADDTVAHQLTAYSEAVAAAGEEIAGLATDLAGYEGWSAHRPGPTCPWRSGSFRRRPRPSPATSRNGESIVSRSSASLETRS